MIVLDEQLLGRGIEEPIARWYPGAVRFVTELRDGSIIKDEAIPMLLSGESEPTFVTINETDFWRRVPISSKFCVVCLPLPLERAGEIPAALQRLFRHTDFRTKAQRMGSVVRVTANGASYYTATDKMVRTVENW